MCQFVFVTISFLLSSNSSLRSSFTRCRFVRRVGAGAYHLLVITVEGTSGGGVLWTCGLNNYGQLGLGDIEPRHELTCVSVLTGERVEDADGGMHHSVCLTSDGKVFSFGRGDSGQLGVTDECEVGYCEENPVKVALPGAKGIATSVSCGANHNFIITNKNEVYSWGYGDMMALGHGRDRDENIPKLMKIDEKKFPGATVVTASGGGQHSAIIINQPK